MDLGLRGKKVFVTGGSAGIGQAMVRTFAAEGADVAFTYLSNLAAAEALVAEVEEAGGKGFAVRMDVRDHPSVQAAVEAVATALGQPRQQRPGGAQGA